MIWWDIKKLWTQKLIYVNKYILKKALRMKLYEQGRENDQPISKNIKTRGDSLKIHKLQALEEN